MNKKGYIILWSVVGAMVLAIAIGIVFAVKEKLTRITAEEVDVSGWLTSEDATVNHYYSATTGQFENASDTFFIFNEDGSFAMQNGSSSLGQGTYTINKNEILTTYQSSYSGETSENKMLIEGNYLFFESNVCSGDTIPDDDTFEAKVARVDNTGYGYQYEFRKDGTFTLTHGTAKDCRKWTVTEGTYKRNSDNTLTITLNEKAMLPLYISHGHLVSSFYTAITDEQYNEAMSQIQQKESEAAEKANSQ